MKLARLLVYLSCCGVALGCASTTAGPGPLTASNPDPPVAAAGRVSGLPPG